LRLPLRWLLLRLLSTRRPGLLLNLPLLLRPGLVLLAGIALVAILLRVHRNHRAEEQA